MRRIQRRYLKNGDSLLYELESKAELRKAWHAWRVANRVEVRPYRQLSDQEAAEALEQLGDPSERPS